MFLHFANVLKMCTVQPQIGPLIITVFTMMGDIQKVFALILFFFVCFHSCFHALYRNFEATYDGEAWSPFALLVDALWGNQIMWKVENEHGQSLFMSLIMGF